MNETQALYMELIRRTERNALDGKKVAQDLCDHPALWQSAVLWSMDSLIVLRDIPEDFNNADTLYLVAAPGKERKLEKLAQKWNADCVTFLEEDEVGRLLGASGDEYNVLRCWWD